MPTWLYDKGRNAFLSNFGTTGGQINWVTDTISAILVHGSGGTGYGATGATQPSQANDQYYSTISSIATAVVAGPNRLTLPTSVAGVAGCDNIVFTAVSQGSVQVDAIVIFKNTGTPTSSALIAYIDSAGATGLPVTPNGSNITLTIDTGANKLFKL